MLLLHFTRVSDAVIFTLPPHVVDDDNPHQGRPHHTAHHDDDHDAHCGPAILLMGDAALGRVTVGGCQNVQVDMAAFSAQRVGHNARVFPSILQSSIYNDQQLICCSKKMPLGDHQRAVIFSPVEARGRIAPSYALQHCCFTPRYRPVFQRPHEGRSFCDRGEKNPINCKVTSLCNASVYYTIFENLILQLNLHLSHKSQRLGNSASSALLWITAANVPYTTPELKHPQNDASHSPLCVPALNLHLPQY